MFNWSIIFFRGLSLLFGTCLTVSCCIVITVKNHRNNQQNHANRETPICKITDWKTLHEVQLKHVDDIAQTNTFIPGLLSLTSLRNNGAAWSILTGRIDIFIVITIVAVIVLAYAMWRLRAQRLYMWGISFMMAGTLGNFIDRIRAT